MPIYRCEKIRPVYKQMFPHDPFVCTNDGRSTEIVEPPEEIDELIKTDSQLIEKVGLRFMSDRAFIGRYGSRYLQLVERAGLAFGKRCLKERVRSVFGENAECLPSSQVMMGDMSTHEDPLGMEQALEEICAVMNENSLGDVFETMIFEATYFPNQKGEKKRVVFGIRYSKTSAHFVPPKSVVFVVFLELDLETHTWGKPVPSPI